MGESSFATAASKLNDSPDADCLIFSHVNKSISNIDFDFYS